MYKFKPKYSPFLTLLFAVLLMVFMFIGEVAKGQTKTFLTGDKTGDYIKIGLLGVGSASMSNPPMSYQGGLSDFFYGTSILNDDNITTIPVTVTAARSISALVVLAGADMYIQFRTAGNAELNANTTTYFKLGTKPVLSGVGVPLLGLLGLAELKNISGTAYINAGNFTTGLGATPNEGSISGTSVTNLLIDKNGLWYAGVTPNAKYNSVKLKVAFPTDINVLDLGRELTAKVYNAFTLAEGTCSYKPAFSSPGEATGITIQSGALVGGLELSQLIANPELAINDNLDDYSAFSSGVASIGIASSVSQSFYFDHKASTSDQVRLQLGITNSLVDLDLLALSRIKFKLYNGTNTTPVYEKTLDELSQLLSLNLLNLVAINGGTHKKLDLTFTPGIAFDRLSIVYEKGVADVNALGDALRIYDVSMASSLPNITVQPSALGSTNICDGGIANFSVNASASGGGSISGYQWQYWDGSSWVSAPSGTSDNLSVTTTSSMNNRLYRVIVSGGSASCPKQIISNEVSLTVRTTNVAADIAVTDADICEGHAATLTPTSSLTGPLIFNWYKDANKTTPITTGGNYAIDAGGKLTITGLTALNSPYSYFVSVSNSTACENKAGALKEAKVIVKPIAHQPLINITN